MRLNKEIAPFDGTNYGIWSHQVKFRLMEKGLWKLVDEAPLECKISIIGEERTLETEESASYQHRVTEEVRDKDQRALGIIGNHVKPEFVEQMSSAKTAREAWDALKSISVGHSAGSISVNRGKFDKARMSEGKDLVVYLGELEQIQSACKDLEAPITDVELILKVTSTLPKSWDSFCQGLRAQKNYLSSYMDIKAQLLAEWNLRNSTAVSGTESPSRHQRSALNSEFPYKCHACGLRGHRRKDCRRRQGQGRQFQIVDKPLKTLKERRTSLKD